MKNQKFVILDCAANFKYYQKPSSAKLINKKIWFWTHLNPSAILDFCQNSNGIVLKGQKTFH
jgi:hypothetical protein